MKKVLLAVVLLALVVGVSYVKSVRNAESRKAAYREGKAESVGQLADYEQQVDSLRLAMGEREVAFADSMIRTQAGYQSDIDSLTEALAGRDKRIGELDSKLKETSQPKATGSQKVSSSVSKKHEQILSYYKQRYKSLPTDLTDYEKKVAINEIREETARKYSITLAELKSLREKYKLNY